MLEEALANGFIYLRTTGRLGRIVPQDVDQWEMFQWSHGEWSYVSTIDESLVCAEIYNANGHVFIKNVIAPSEIAAHNAGSTTPT